MINDYTVICSKGNIKDDKELILSVQKVMLITLFETEKINMAQYTYAAQMLEQKFQCIQHKQKHEKELTKNA